MGVGDNLRAAVTDIYTADQPVAASWVNHMMADMVNGNGSIDPGLAFARVERQPLGSTRERLVNPQQIALEIMGMIASGPGIAIQAHRGVAGG
jgi:Mg-chelatase subunit ChlI